MKCAGARQAIGMPQKYIMVMMKAASMSSSDTVTTQLRRSVADRLEFSLAFASLSLKRNRYDCILADVTHVTGARVLTGFYVNALVRKSREV